MNTVHTPSAPSFLQPRKTVKPVNFYCSAPDATTVFLVGDFNDWNPTSTPMRRREDGCWFVQVSLPHGHHQYRFLVDGRPTLDPMATGVAHGEANDAISLIAVS